jgi:hypothetical protein
VDRDRRHFGAAVTASSSASANSSDLCGQAKATNPDVTEPRARNVPPRFTRLTNAFSKKLENHAAMVAVYFMFYNFGRVHQTLRVTPAMEAGIANHVWTVDEIVGLLDT